MASFTNQATLTYNGAQVLHEMTIFPVREKNIPLNIRNTNEPDHPGTLITLNPTAKKIVPMFECFDAENAV